MKRKIVGISGPFALADDGSCWMWTDTGWKPWGRGELPDSEGLDFYQTTSSPPWPTTQGVPSEYHVPPANHSTTFHADGSISQTIAGEKAYLHPEVVAAVERGEYRTVDGAPEELQPQNIAATLGAARKILLNAVKPGAGDIPPKRGPGRPRKVQP